MIDIRIPSGDWSLAATLSGEHPRLVFLHPGVADRRCWYDVMSALVPDFPAVAYDRRGFGETPAADAPFVDVDDLRAVLDACVVGPAVLVGNSQGGRIAIDFALAQPERVDRLVLIAPAVSGAPERTGSPRSDNPWPYGSALPSHPASAVSRPRLASAPARGSSSRQLSTLTTRSCLSGRS